MTDQMQPQYPQPMTPGYVPPPPAKKKWPYVVLGILVGVVVIIAAISVCFIVAVGKGVDKAEEVGLIGTETHAGAIGTPVECGNNLILTVHGTQPFEGDRYFHPGDGFTYLIADVSFENTGNESESISIMMEITAKDSAGREYDNEYISSVPPLLPEGDIAPGETIRGNVAFKVPKGTQDFTFKFEPLLGDTALIKL